MMQALESKIEPNKWRLVMDRLEMNQNQLARLVGVHRSWVCIGLKKQKPIPQKHFRKILDAAKELGANLTADDLIAR